MTARTGSARAALALAMALLATTTACSSDGVAATSPPTSAAAGTPTGADRGATEDKVDPDWDTDFTVSIVNSSTAPVEVGVSMDPRPGGDKEQYVGPSGAATSFTPAGKGRLLVVPAATSTTASKRVDMVVKQKLGLTPQHTTTTGRPDAISEVQDLLISLPTMQVRFKITYAWSSNCVQKTDYAYPYHHDECSNDRKATVNIQTRTGDGYQLGYNKIATCLNPVRIEEIGSAISDPTAYWNAVPIERFNQLTIDVLPASKLSTDTCTGDPIVGVAAPGMSLAPLSKPASRLNLSEKHFSAPNFAGTDLAWADLSGAEMSGFPRANLAYADLRSADLTGTVLTDANLVGTRLDGALVDADTSFDGALLFGTDLSKVDIQPVAPDKPAELPWTSFDDALFCNTKLPQSMIDAYVASWGVEPDLDAHCGDKLSAHLEGMGVSGTIVDASSAMPITLAQQNGSFDCPAPSTVGSFRVVYVGSNCSGSYAATSLPGPTPTGSVDVGTGGPVNATGGLAIAKTAPAGGWTGLVCSSALAGVATDGCTDAHRELP